MAKKKRYVPGLYKSFLVEQGNNEEVRQYAEELDVPEEQIVIEKVKTLPKLLSILSHLFLSLLKICVIGVVTVLASVGLTVLVNAVLRDAFIDFIKNIF